MEKFDGTPGDFRRAMTVTGQFNVDKTGVFVLAEDAEDGGEIKFAVTEHEVFVFAITDVLNVDIADEVGKFAVHLPEGLGFGAEDVTDIERQPEAGAGDVFLENFKFSHVVYEHAGFGFEGKLDAAAFGVFG